MKQTKVQLMAALILIVVGCLLLIAAFIVPPEGEIHSSVLVAFGEILTFVGALFGISINRDLKDINDLKNQQNGKI